MCDRLVAAFLNLFPLRVGEKASFTNAPLYIVFEDLQHKIKKSVRGVHFFVRWT